MKIRIKLIKQCLGYLQRTSSSVLTSRIRDIAYAIYRSANNPSYQMMTNGELRAIGIISKFFDRKTFFDVGANVGQWSVLAAKSFERDGYVYSFEPCGRTYESLLCNTNGLSSVKCFNVGLSNSTQSMDILFSGKNPEKSSVEGYGVRSLNKKIEDYEAETQSFMRGDEFCENNSIEEISFLKIDTEGHDFKVLEGFSGMLRAGKIHAIQFEYNRLNIYAKILLHDFYELLNPPSSPETFCIGRIFPQSVRFKEYDPLDENFIDGNFLAVRRAFGPLIDEMKN